MTLSRKLRLALLLVLLVSTVGCDQTTKHLARSGLSQTDSVKLAAGFVEFRLAENPGSFLSFGALFPDSVRFAVFTFGIGVCLILMLPLLSHPRLNRIRFVGLSLVAAGGLSNLLDRIFRHGLVTDFITIHIGPFHTGIFNLADVLIMAGVAVILWSVRRGACAEK